MMTSGMHRRPFEGRHLAILIKFSYRPLLTFSIQRSNTSIVFNSFDFMEYKR